MLSGKLNNNTRVLFTKNATIKEQRHVLGPTRPVSVQQYTCTWRSMAGIARVVSYGLGDG